MNNSEKTVNPKGNIQNLKPYKKGQSGNPAGYPKGQKNRATILKKWIEVAVKFKDPITEEEISGTVEDKISLSLINKALSGDVQAIKEINDTLYGKIPDTQKFNHTTKGDSMRPLEIIVQSKEQGEKFKELIDYVSKLS